MRETSEGLAAMVQASRCDPDLRQQQRDGGKVTFDKGFVKSWRMDVEDATDREIRDDSLFQL